MKKTRVLIVEDSQVVRELLQHIINSDPRLEVAATVESAEAAMRLLNRVAPDVISMDINLPGIDGLTATQRIMQERPTPIVIVSGAIAPNDQHTTVQALRAGALSIVEKPAGSAHPEFQKMAERLCTQLAIMSQVKLVRRHNRPRSTSKPPPAAPAPSGQFQILGVVASTGGPAALVELLKGLGDDFPLPIVLVQHITAGFLEGFVRWLTGVCPFDVHIVAGGERPRARTIYLAPADHHLHVGPAQLRITRQPPVCAQRPSGTVLFQSMARSFKNEALGVLLTGMGEDGAEGLLAIRQAGGHTLAEDASTAVVYGMPAAAVERGAVCDLLPLHALAPRIRRLTVPPKKDAAWKTNSTS